MSANVPTSDEFARLVERVAELEARLAAAADQPEWLDAKQAAAYLGCTVGRIQKLKQRGALPFAQEAPGHRVHFSKTELDRAMRTLQTEGRNP